MFGASRAASSIATVEARSAVLMPATSTPSSMNLSGGRSGFLIETFTTASPGHFCFDTASAITPPCSAM